MRSTIRITRALAAGAAFFAAQAGCVFDDGSSLHREGSVDVDVVRGSPTCAAIGYSDAVELVVSPVANTSLTHDSGFAVTVETDEAYFDFSASPGVDAVIAAGDGVATVYRYSRPALGDASLAAPGLTLLDGGEVERITFCRVAIGCTLAPEAWLRAADSNVAGVADGWGQLPGGAHREFFLSGRSYLELLAAPPDRNDIYLMLARVYIAAELSQLAGAKADSVAEAFADATEILEAYTPDELGSLAPSSGLYEVVVELKELLADYVSGYLGPGQCDRGAGHSDGAPR